MQIMSRRFTLFGIFMLSLFLGGGQILAQDYFAVADGDWSDPATWASTQGGAPSSGAGNGFPEAGSTAYTEGYEIYVDQNVTVANLAIRDTNNAGAQINFGGLFTPFTITITNILSGVDASLNGSPPTESVIDDTADLVFLFTGTTGGGNGVIRNWSYLAPINTVHSSGANIRSGTVAQGGFLAITESLVVLSGTFRPRANLADASGSAILQVDPGATLSLNTANVTGDGTLGTKFNEIQIGGTVTLTAAFSLSTENIAIASGGQLTVGFTGGNQTEGWWHQSASPSSIALDESSTVVYNAAASQNIYGTIYGNLTLSGAGFTKTLAGTLEVQGNLTVNNNVTFAPTTTVIISGGRDHAVSGGGTFSVLGGIEVAKSANTFTLSKALTIQNGITVTSGALNLGTVTTTLASGDFVIDGSVTSSGAGTFIVAGTSNFSGTGSLTLRNLTTQITTGVATINNDPWTITGNIVNDGTLVLPSTSTVIFSGGSLQTISGNGFDIGNIEVSKTSSTLRNNVTLNLSGLLNMVNGTFDADGVGGVGTFILNSDSNGDARIGPMTGGSIAGNVTFERFYDNTAIPQLSQWRNFGFPVSNVDYSELASLSLGFEQLATYTESIAGSVDQGWQYPSSGPLNSALGHTAWMNSPSGTISVRGPLVSQTSGAFNYAITYTNNGTPQAVGLNFIANPYASPIDWAGSGWVKTNIGGVAVVWDQFNQTYQTAGIVAQGQGFWVQATAASPSLQSTEAVKTTDTDPFFYREANIEKSKVFISLKSGRFEDVTTIQFRKDATEEHDAPYDFYKLKNGIYNLSSITKGGANLMVNVLPETRCASPIKLNITNIDPGTYNISFRGIESFDNLQSITLIDNFTQKAQVIKPEDVYSFEVTSDPETFGSERFAVQFEFTDQAVAPVISKEDNRLTSSSLDGNQWFLNDAAIEGATGRSFVPRVHGEYYVTTRSGECTAKSEKIFVTEGLTRIFPNPASEWLKVDVYNLLKEGATGRIVISSTMGQLVKDETFTGRDTVKEIDIAGVKPGTYMVTVVSNTGVILEKSKVIIK